MNESDALEAACRAYIGTRQDGTHPWDDEATRNDTFARHLRVGMARALAAARDDAAYPTRDTSMMGRAKALRAKATAGPWYVQLSYGTGPDDHDGEPYCQWEIYSAGGVDDPCVLSGAGDLDVEGNARFIAAAPELVDGLIDEVERLRAKYDASLPPARVELRRDDGGLLDDVVVREVSMFRLERMDTNLWWGCCYLDGDERVDFQFRATRGVLEVTTDD